MFKINKKSFCLDKGSFYIKNFKYKILFFSVIFILSIILYKSGIGCVWKYIFNIECPGCGITRAWLSLLNGDIKQAFKYNFMFLSVPILFIYILYDGKIFKRKNTDSVILILIGIGFFIKWLLFL